MFWLLSYLLRLSDPVKVAKKGLFISSRVSVEFLWIHIGHKSLTIRFSFVKCNKQLFDLIIFLGNDHKVMLNSYKRGREKRQRETEGGRNRARESEKQEGEREIEEGEKRDTFILSCFFYKHI